jgi:DedD protein
VDTSLKQRLVGAALLIALAVIFIPMFFDDASREKPATLDMDVPPKPKYTFAEPANASPKSKPAQAKVQGETASRDEEKVETVAGAAAPRPAEAALSETRPKHELAQAPVTEPAPTQSQKLASQDQPATPVQVREPASHNPPTPPKQAHESASQDQPATPVQVREPASKDVPADELAMVKPPAEPPIDELQAPGKLSAPAAALPPKLPGEFLSPRPKSIEWAVQVGSFSEYENAATLRDDLQSSGFTAFEEKAVSDGEQVFRVMVGPEKDRKRAEALRARLRNQKDLDGIVVDIYPAASGS